jgi:hypothetical protein
LNEEKICKQILDLIFCVFKANSRSFLCSAKQITFLFSLRLKFTLATAFSFFEFFLFLFSEFFPVLKLVCGSAAFAFFSSLAQASKFCWEIRVFFECAKPSFFAEQRLLGTFFLAIRFEILFSEESFETLVSSLKINSF